MKTYPEKFLNSLTLTLTVSNSFGEIKAKDADDNKWKLNQKDRKSMELLAIV